MNVKDEPLQGKQHVYEWASSKEILLRLPKGERQEWLSEQLSALGLIVGPIIGILLIPWFRVLHIHSTITIGLWMLFALYGGSYAGKRLARYLSEEACIDLLGHICCKLGKHDLKPDGVFISSGCQCVRCGYRPTGRALVKLR